MRSTANLVFSGDVFGFIRDFKTRIKFVGRYEQPRALTKSLNLHLLPPKERNEKRCYMLSHLTELLLKFTLLITLVGSWRLEIPGESEAL